MGFFGFSFQKNWPFFHRQRKADRFERVWNIFTIAIVVGFLLFKIGQIPVGLFCDEAIIGVRAQELLDGITEPFLTPFYYHHFNYILPTLSVGATVPFVWLFGLSEFSVRLASIFFGLLSLFFVYKTLRLLKLEWRWPVIALAFTPLFFHLSRVNFGNAVSFCAVAAAFFFYARYEHTKRLSSLILAGISFGLGTYANVSGLILVPMIIASLGVSHLILQKKVTEKLSVLTLGVVFFFMILPHVWTALLTPAFFNRFHDKKGEGPLVLRQEINRVLTNYPKYYSWSFLFADGEIKQPGAFITRHSIEGLGTLSPLLLIFFFLALFSWKKWTTPQKIFFVTSILVFLFAPLTDAITTNKDKPPYSISLYLVPLIVPFISALGLTTIRELESSLRQWQQWLAVLPTLVLFLLFFTYGIRVSHAYFINYPLVSADYWGWQYGASPILSYFAEHQDEYDQLLMTGDFNGADMLLQFYTYPDRCPKCILGGPDQFNRYKKQLFAVRVSEFEGHAKRHPELYFTPQAKVTLPDGKVEYLIGEFTAQPADY